MHMHLKLRCRVLIQCYLFVINKQTKLQSRTEYIKYAIQLLQILYSVFSDELKKTSLWIQILVTINLYRGCMHVREYK